MRRLKIIIVLLAVVICTIKKTDVSAYDILSSSSTQLTSGQLKMWYSNPGDPETYAMQAMYIGDNFRLFRYSASPSPSDFRVQEIIGRPSMTYANPTIAHLMIRFSRGTGATNSAVPTGFEGLRGANNEVVMSRNCIPIEEIDYGNTSYVNFYQCDYWLYVPPNSQTYNLKGEIWFPSQADWIIDLYGYVDSIILADPLSSSDIENLGETITNAIEDLQISVEGAGGATPAQIQSAAESAIESARESEKTEYEEQQEDVESGAEDAGDEAEAATSTLIETGRNIIETIRDTPATNCVIRINTGNFDTGNLNLCNVPQVIRTMISSVITIPVTLAALHIAYSVVMLYLTTVRKEQE